MKRIKWNEMRRLGANVNVYCETYKARSKRLYTVILIVIYSGKNKIIVKAQRWVVTRKGFLGRWTYSVYLKVCYTSLDTFQNP